jgi:hypothetical protein
MPSAKPDYKEISSLRKERKLYEPGPNLFSGLYEVCRSTLEGGYVTKERAEKLFSFLRANDKVSVIFPNNLLYKILDFACAEGNWSSVNEKLLLSFIGEFYLDYSLEDQSVVGIELGVSSDLGIETKPLTTAEHPELIKPPDIQFALLDFIRDEGMFSCIARKLLFDRMPEHINFRKRFVGFTGNFDDYTRRMCFEVIRKNGGVPSDPEYFTDYFFVARKSIDQIAISNQFAAAICFRRLFGKPLIYTEDVWNKILGLESGETQKNT